ncbi:oleosin H2-like [Tasmannia lanceolata]|uniref:oleosin H2-like n=1 Tax=Tasmannia lanceolata TaxID=3420 RepID=UPI00406405BA
MATEHQQQQQHPSNGFKSMLPEKGPTASQVIAVITLFPLGGILLTLSGLTLTGTVIGTALATPVFILFSPVLVPAAIVLTLAVAGFLMSGALGITALSSLSWMVNYLRGVRGPEQLEHGKRRMHEAAGHLGLRTGQGMQEKTREGGGRT